MPFTFQYNKTALHQLNKQLKMRFAALPVLKNKESALRIEVARYRAEWQRWQQELRELEASAASLLPLLSDFPVGVLEATAPELTYRKIAGVLIPEFDNLSISLQSVVWNSLPSEALDVVPFLRRLAEGQFREQIAAQQVAILERERKRTTQKVNLYEKVQIPQLEDALKKIKRFLEDEQNLAKSAQKMVKARKQSA